MLLKFMVNNSGNFDDLDSDVDNEDTDDQLPNQDEKLGFVNPATAIGLAKAAREGVRTGKRVFRAAKQIRSGDFEGAADSMNIDEAKELLGELRQLKNAMGDFLGSNGPNGPTDTTFTVDYSSGGGDSKGGRPNDYLNVTRLNIEPHPIEIRLSTGIKPDAYTPDYLSTETSYVNPVHYTGGMFLLPTYTDSPTTIIDTWWRTIVNEIYIVAQRNVTYNIGSAGITKASISAYLGNLSLALQYYYGMSRFLVYISDKNKIKQKNECFEVVANTITGSHADNFVALSRHLNSLPIPPNLNEFCYYLMQHYVASDLPSGPVIGINPFGLSAGLPTWAPIASALNNLSTQSATDTASLLGKAIPHWYLTELFTGGAIPKHDPNFTTIWCNLPFTMSGNNPSTHSVVGPAISDDDTRIYYNSFTENLDGAAYALCGGKTGSTWLPCLFGLLTSTASSNTTSRYSWSSNGFIDSYVDNSACFSRDETYGANYAWGNTIGYQAPIGTQRVWGVSARAIANSACKLLDHVIGWRSIISPLDKRFDKPGPFNPSKGKFVTNPLNVANNPSGPSGGRRRKKKGGR